MSSDIIKHQVGSDESIPSIAEDRGFFWETLWNHPDNASLKQDREDPNVLLEGDIVAIPALRLKTESRPSEAKHTFKRKGVPLKFRMKLMRYGKPRANVPYVLEIEGKLLEGATNADGLIEQWIPGNAAAGTLMLNGGKETYAVDLSRLDPVSTISGVQQRLKNLGFGITEITGTLNERTKQALRAFQAKQGLTETGEPDEATRAKLKKLHP